MTAKQDALGELLHNAPADDEPTTLDEEEGVREAREEIARGDVFSPDRVRHAAVGRASRSST